jgi:quercetin dioxygenase-like cupin family protein
MHITSLDKVKKTVPAMEGAKGILKQIPISKEDGTPSLSFRVFTIEPGGHTPYHNHQFEHLNYILEGSGVVVGENKETSIKKGDFVMVPPGETHQYKNTSTSGTLVFICAVPKEYE